MVDFYPKIDVLGPYTPLFKGFGENLRFTAVTAPVLERKNQNPMQFFREKIFGLPSVQSKTLFIPGVGNSACAHLGERTIP